MPAAPSRPPARRHRCLRRAIECLRDSRLLACPGGGGGVCERVRDVCFGLAPPRVIGADGRLTGYGGGLPRKEWLLHHEGAVFRTNRTPASQSALPFNAC